MARPEGSTIGTPNGRAPSYAIGGRPNVVLDGAGGDTFNKALDLRSPAAGSFHTAPPPARRSTSRFDESSGSNWT